MKYKVRKRFWGALVALVASIALSVSLLPSLAGAATISLSTSGISELMGEVTLDAAGMAPASAGDVNGDGYADFLVATKTNDDTGLNAGAAYLVYGRATALTSESLGGSSNTVVEFTGEATGDYAGTAVGAAGDVNNDGYDDFLIGAYQPGPGVGAGVAYLVYGKAAAFAPVVSLGDSSIVKFTGELMDDKAGAKVSTAGDVNHDGYADMLFAAPGDDTTAANAGATYLIYGKAATFTSASFSTAEAKFTGEGVSDGSGTAIASGDFNNDTYSDILISANAWDAANYGRTYLFYGQAAALVSANLNTANAIFTGEVAEDTSGGSINSAGDLNNDGYDEILIGAAANDDAGTTAGATYLIYGQAAALPSSNLSTAIEFTGEAAGDGSGTWVSTVGDLNHDGYDEILIGAPTNDDAGADAGSSYIIYGQAAALTSTSLSTASTEFTGEAAGDRAGTGVSGAGDVNGDGTNDILIGSRFNDDSAVDAGATYVVYYQPPFASLTAGTQGLLETVGTATVTAQISSTFTSAVTIPYTVSGTATGGGVDYTLANGNFSIIAGMTTADVTFPITDDAIAEATETIIVTLGTPNYGSLISPSVQTITITDNEIVPTVASVTAVQNSSGGTVAIGFIIDDANDDNTVQAKVEYSLDGGSTWFDPSLSSTVTATFGAPTVDNAATYQVGQAGSYITTSSGANTIGITWNAFTDVATTVDISNAQIRITPYDGTGAGSAGSSASFIVDRVAPSGLANFNQSNFSTAQVTLNWVAATDSHFNHYEIWHGSIQSDVQNRTGAAVKWDNTNDAALATASTATTTITIDPRNLFYKIWAVDNYGNETTLGDFAITPSNSSSGSSGSSSSSSSGSSSTSSSAGSTTTTTDTGTTDTTTDTTTTDTTTDTGTTDTTTGTISFSDTGEHWADTVITFMADKGIVQGNPDGTFDPDGNLNRAEAAALLWRVLMRDTATVSSNPFSDVDMNAWYAPYVSGLLDLGLVAGNPDGTYQPAEEINRAEFLQLAMNVYLYQNPSLDISTVAMTTAYQDLDSSAWYAQVVSAATSWGFVEGSACGTKTCFKADNEITRAEATTILYNMFASSL